jgi:hypothetical protein
VVNWPGFVIAGTGLVIGAGIGGGIAAALAHV